jgi:hypothetical protein
MAEQFDEPRQSIMARLGDEGCYIHSLVYIAQQRLKRRVDTIPVYQLGVLQKWILLDCTIKDAASVMGCMTGLEWEKVFVPALIGGGVPTLPVGTIALVMCFARWASPNRKVTHFVVGNLNWEVEFDPLGNALSNHPGYQLDSARALSLTGKLFKGPFVLQHGLEGVAT